MTIFVTGATAGFGRAIARKFAQDGAKIVGTGRREGTLHGARAKAGAFAPASDPSETRLRNHLRDPLQSVVTPQ
ncbi:MAG: SDR family NAD(P)-dependent oxidoreductase [Bryobacteraceae bacterium]